MGKQMTVGKRITLGFAGVIVIMVALGGMAVWNMHAAKVESAKLADEYVPEVDVAAQVRGAANRVMYEMRGYGFTEDETFYQNAQKEMGDLDQALDACRALDEKAVYLTKLAGQIEVAQSAVDEYKALVEQTVATTARMADARKALDENAAAYMKNCADFLANQNAALTRDFEERLQKIQLTDGVVAAGTKTRVLNFRAQALDDPELLDEAIATINNVTTFTDRLRPITRDPADIERIENVLAAADKYEKNMTTFLEEFRKGQSADKAALGACRERMDEAAAVFVSNCDDFMAGQYAALERDITERHTKITLANDVLDIGNATRVAAFKSQALRDPATMRAGIRGLDVLADMYADLREITRLEADLEAIANTERAGKAYGAAMERFLTEWETLQEIGAKRTEAGHTLITAAKTTADAAMEATNGIATDCATSLARSTTIMVGGLIGGTIMAILAALYIARSITGPLGRAVETLSSGAEQVTSAAGQVSQSSQSLAEGASEQASSLEETSASLEEITSMTRQNTENSTQAKGLAAQAQGDAETGNEAMGRMSQAIDEIKKSADETAGIVKTIEEIAFQTNLLALNAAVEAARAGDAGKGFAVVAEEVRNLAQRAAEAARNTGELITGSVKNAENGVAISREVAESLGKIAEGSAKVNQIASEVAAAGHEQLQGIEQVNTAVSQMDQVTQQNAANSEEGASAAEELTAQAQEMMKVVDELAGLVGAASGNGNGKAALGLGRKHSMSGSARRSLPAPAQGKRAPAATRAASTQDVVSPEQVIPLDDEDMDDF